jgi:hypothetical protein
MEGVKEEGDVELYAKLDSAYSSDEEDVEVSCVGSTTFSVQLTLC